VAQFANWKTAPVAHYVDMHPIPVIFCTVAHVEHGKYAPVALFVNGRPTLVETGEGCLKGECVVALKKTKLIIYITSFAISMSSGSVSLITIYVRFRESITDFPFKSLGELSMHVDKDLFGGILSVTKWSCVIFLFQVKINSTLQ